MRTLIIAIMLGFTWGSSAGLGATPITGPADPNAEAVLRDALLRQFDALLQDPNAFARRVRRECVGFPEGDLMSYTMPACAYVQVGLSDPSRRAESIRRVEQLLALARPGVLKRVKTDAQALAGISDYQKQAVYLGQYNLALGGYRLLGGKRLADEHKAISDALHAALARGDGRPLASYPHLTWTFDTIPCLVSLRVYDRLAGNTRSDAVIARHLAWIARRATHPGAGVPFSRVVPQTGKAIVAPRGCELSWRVALMADLDATAARGLYANYVRSFWLDRKVMAGFAEWPGGKNAKQDFDSGPVVMGIGSAATAFGIAAAGAGGDEVRREVLVRQAASGKELLKRLIAMNPKSASEYTLAGKIDTDSAYQTGFLFGDACLFYAVTWRPWLANERPAGQ